MTILKAQACVGSKFLKKLVTVSISWALTLSVVSCASVDEKSPEVPQEAKEVAIEQLERRKTPAEPDSLASDAAVAIDEPTALFNSYRPKMNQSEFDQLHQDLGVKKTFDLMGFSESAFKSCPVTGETEAHRCQIDFYSNIHFLLLCRDAHESSQTAFDASRMQPLGNRIVKWSLKDQQGTVVLDDKGYGKISLKAQSSQRNERLKLSIENESLYVQAGEIGRVVTPPDWCQNQ